MAKGADFEREISKYLSKWIQGTEKPYLFWRMPGSGGLATISEENAGLSGDIRSLSPKSEWFCEIFSIELKNGYPKTSFWQHFANIKNFNIEKFWKQCYGDAIKSDRQPFLIYKKKGRQPIMGIAKEIYDDLYDLLKDLPVLSMSFKELSKLPTIVFCDFKDFFNTVNPDTLKERLYGKN